MHLYKKYLIESVDLTLKSCGHFKQAMLPLRLRKKKTFHEANFL